MAGKNGILPTILVFTIIAGAMTAVYFYYFKKNIPDYSNLPEAKAHFYSDASIGIKKIGLKIFYAVPANKKDNVDPGWQKTITETIEKISRFHALQLHGLSEINYDIYPEPVLLREEDIFYNTASTNLGNPRGLISIAEEIAERVLREGGDLYKPEFAGFEEGEYPVMGLIYEGVGASGGVIYDTSLGTAREIAEELSVPESIVYLTDVKSVRGFFILNREFLTSKELSIFGATTLYHELAHTIGLPDRDESAGLSAQNDIMGGGRRDPLEAAYIAGDLLEGLGVLE